MAITPRGSGLNFDVNGSYRVGTSIFKVATSVIINTAHVQYIVGDERGNVSVSPTAPPSVWPPTNQLPVLLATVTPVKGAAVAHHSWLTLYPPVDNHAAQARKVAYDAGAWSIPGRDKVVGMVQNPINELTDFTCLTALTVPRSTDPNAPVWLPGSKTLQFSNCSNMIYTNGKLIGGTCYFAPNCKNLSFRNFKVDSAGQQTLNSGFIQSQVDDTFGLVIEDTHITNSTGALGPGGGDGINLTNCVVRRCLIENIGNGVRASFAGLYEDLHIRHNGLVAGDHGACIGAFSSLEFGGRDAGYCRFNRLNLEVPSPSSPSRDGTTTTAAFAVETNGTYSPYVNGIFENSRINGGTLPIAINTSPDGNVVRRFVFRNLWFTRNYEFNGNVGGVFNLRAGVGGMDVGNYDQIVIYNCFWEDTGELIRGTTGMWNSDSAGNPVHASLPAFDPVSGEAITAAVA